MNNKKLGTEFEQEVCKLLASKGYWVHFIVPDARGAQPFDIIAVKAGRSLAIDCKTCVAGSFNISRLEDNQITSFDLWRKCGNEEPLVFVKHNQKIYIIPYIVVKTEVSVKLTDKYFYCMSTEE